MTDSTEGNSEQSPRSLWSRLSMIALMALVLIVAGMLSAVTAMKFAIRGGEVIVPGLISTREPEAAALLHEQGLELVVDGRRFSSAVPEGEILEQSPPAGVHVKRDRRIRVRISLGDRLFPVPDIRGASLRSAQLMLTQRGMAVGGTLYSHSADGDAGTVVFQTPRPGAQESDPAVNVLVSLGPVDQYFVMPTFTGQSVAAARNTIRAAGFRLSEVPDPESTSRPGTVVSQQPLPGHRVSKNDTILVGVSQ